MAVLENPSWYFDRWVYRRLGGLTDREPEGLARVQFFIIIDSLA